MDDRRKNIATASHGGSGGSNFQMPLHYPRYTKEEYKELPEGMIDRLLAEYGLSSSGHHDLESKREFAIGAFLWPPQHVPGHHAGDLDHRCRLNMNVWSLLREIDERDADCEMSENEMPDVTGEGELSFAGCNVCERDNPMPPEIGREWEMPATEEQA
ncbi:hypothetical protein R6Q59_035587 [Mikania micrantha]